MFYEFKDSKVRRTTQQFCVVAVQALFLVDNLFCQNREAPLFKRDEKQQLLNNLQDSENLILPHNLDRI
jgi:hypothetical protein